MAPPTPIETRGQRPRGSVSPLTYFREYANIHKYPDSNGWLRNYRISGKWTNWDLNAFELSMSDESVFVSLFFIFVLHRSREWLHECKNVVEFRWQMACAEILWVWTVPWPYESSTLGSEIGAKGRSSSRLHSWLRSWVPKRPTELTERFGVPEGYGYGG